MGVAGYLLDTHVALWLMGDPERVPSAIRDKLSDQTSPLYVSSISAFEVATKTRLGKLAIPGLPDRWEEQVAEIGGIDLPLDQRVARAAGILSWDHRDPFDRILVAQASLKGLILVTVDREVTSFDPALALAW